MDRNTIKQLKDKSIKELEEMAKKLKREVSTIELEKRLGKNKNVREISKKRDDVARILTILRLHTINGETS